MRRSVGQSAPSLRNHPFSAFISVALSTALVLLPVLPVRAALSERAPADARASGQPAHAAAATAPAALAAPSLTATKTDSFDDPDGDGKAEPGQTITYTVTITNNGTDATNVVFSDTVDPNTTLVPDSVRTQPVAAGDSYSVLGNVRIQPNAAAGLLANDCDPDNGGSCSSAGLTASGPTSSAQGGNVAVNPDGSFSYNPPAGYEGPDSFTYTVTDATGLTDTATATFTISGMVWFVDNSAAASGDGRLTSPFNSLAPLNGAGGLGDPDEPTEVIFVHQGNAAYAGGIALENQQRLIGQGTGLDAALTSFGITVPPHSDARPAATGNPAISNAAGNAITLANANAVWFLNASTSAASSAAISAGGVSGATIITNVGISAGGDGSGVSLLNFGGVLSVINSSVACNSTGAAVRVDGGGTNITFTNTPVSQDGGRVVEIDNRTGGEVSFDSSSPVSGTASTGVLLKDNAGAVTFSDLDVAAAEGERALHATNNTGTITTTSGTLSTTNATAVEIVGESSASRTPLNIVLTSVSATAASGGNPPNGILLTNTNGPGASVGFSVVGDGSNTAPGGNASGGTISNTTGPDGGTSGIGVRLENADEVSLRRVTISNHANYAVRGNNVSNFTMEYSTVAGTNGTSGNSDEGSIYLSEATGTNLIKGSLVHGGWENTLRVSNSAGTLAGFTVDDCTISQTAVPEGGDAVRFEAVGNGTSMTLVVRNSRITAARDNPLDATATFGSTMSLAVKGNQISNNHSAIIAAGGGVRLASQGAMSLDFDGNTLRDAVGTALLVIASGNAAPGVAEGDIQGYIRNNVIGLPAVANSGSATGGGISVEASGGGDLDALVVSNNQVFQYNNNGIFINVGDRQLKAVSANVTVAGNTVNTPGTNLTNFNGFHLNAGITSTPAPGDNFAVCLDLKNNNFTGGGKGTISPNNNDVRFRQRILTTVQLPGYTGASSDNAAVISYLLAAPRSNQFTTGNAANTVATGGGGYQNTVPAGTPCAQPGFGSLASAAPPVEADAHQQLAAAGTGAAQQSTEVGFSAAGKFAASQPSLHKAGRGFAYTERAQLLRAVSVTGDFKIETPRAATAPMTTLSGGNVNVNIGTLRAGDSVTLTFQVTVEDPFTGPQPQVSNQGTVTADGGVSVLTDDPDATGAANPTVTQLLLPPTIRVNDATAVEPAAGSANMLFTVTLSHPYTHVVTVDFDTADGTAAAGDDYTATSGTVTFAVGETVKTVSVPVLADGDAGEGDETFLVDLSGAVGGDIGDGQAVGTIAAVRSASDVIISELRTSGPAGAGDDFVELLNTTDADVTVGAGGWSVVASGPACVDTPTLVAVIPAGTVIPARGNYLLKGAAYSLTAYAAGDQALTADIAGDRNVGLFAAGDLASIGSANRLDAVGFASKTAENCDLLREGATLPAAAGSVSEHSFVRKVTKGLTEDTDDNAADFVVVSTTPSTPVGDNTPTLGAPGPEGSASPRGPVACSAESGEQRFGRAGVDTSAGVGQAPNTVRNTTAVPNGASGTLEFRRTFTNNTGAGVTALRFRVVGLSTFPAAAGAADLRALSSAATVVSTAGGPVTVHGTTLETPPAQASGGGLNSSLAAGTVTLATPLADGASVSLRFLFGVEQPGDYEIAFVLESSPASGKDIWMLDGHTEDGGHTDRGCNRPPVADAGDDQTVECSGGQGFVTLDGTGSSDPDGDTLTYEWKEGATVLGTTPTLGLNLPLGAHTITLTVTDPSGETSEDTVLVTVQDTTPPQITCPDDIVVYLPPNTPDVSMPVNYTVTATDECDASVPVLTTPLSGSIFNVGTTNVTSSATDDANNTATCDFDVWVRFRFTGFFSPISNVPALNTVQAGRGVPVKFSLSGNKGLNIFAAGYPQSTVVACDTGVPEDEVPTVTAGSSSLTYDAATDQYVYIWKTESSWAGQCRQLVVKLTDGTTHVANFKFR